MRNVSKEILEEILGEVLAFPSGFLWLPHLGFVWVLRGFPVGPLRGFLFTSNGFPPWAATCAGTRSERGARRRVILMV